MIERLHAECQLQFPLNHRGFRPSSGPLFRRLLKTQPGASALAALACGAGVSIKPGAQAPGTVKKKIPSPRRRATDDRFCMSGNREIQANRSRCRPLSRARDFSLHVPGAHAPGFMLSPASQADLPRCNPYAGSKKSVSVA